MQRIKMNSFLKLVFILSIAFLIQSPAFAQDHSCNDEDFYLANPNSVPHAVRQLQRQREIIELRVQMAIANNQIAIGTQGLQEINNIDARILDEYRKQAIHEIKALRDPRRLAHLWSQYDGVGISITPLTNCNWNISVNGISLHQNISSDAVIARFRR